MAKGKGRGWHGNSAGHARAARMRKTAAHRSQFARTYKLVKRLTTSRTTALVEAMQKTAAIGGSKKRYGPNSKLAKTTFRREARIDKAVKDFLRG